MKLWIQKVELMAGGKSFHSDNFEIDFKINFSNSDKPNISEVMIYNLSDSTIAIIESQGVVILNAGYGNDVGNILTGKISKPVTEWNGTDKITTLTCGDGSDQWLKTNVNETFAVGSTSQSIISDLAGRLGLEIAEISLNKNLSFPRGKSITGSLQSVLRQMVLDTDSKMYINKERLFIRPRKKGTTTGFLLNSDTGLIGSPQKEESENKKGKKEIKYHIKCLLNHRITTDSIVQVESRTINGNYRVVKGTHNGNFITECEAVPL